MNPNRLSFILIRYLQEKLLVRCGMLLLLFMALYGVIDYVETSSNARATQLYRAYGYKIPEMVSHILPLVLATGVLLTAEALKRRGEWTALLMAGVSTFRISGQLLALPLFLLPVSFFLVHSWAPHGMQAFESAIQFNGVQRMKQYLDGDTIISEIPGGEQMRLQRKSDGRIRRFETVDGNTGGRIHFFGEAEDAPRNPPDELNRSNLQMVPKRSVNGIFAASIPSRTLLAMVAPIRARGGTTALIEATVALRHGQVLATALVPLLSMLLFFVFVRYSSAFGAVVVAIVAAGSYFGMLMISWQLTIAFSLPIWLTPFFCLCGIGLCGVVAAAARIKIRLR